MNGILAFFDTNVLVYADDTSSPTKQDCGIALFAEHLGRGTAVLSLQVLQEYFVAATRKLGLAPDIAQRKVEVLARARIVQLHAADVIAAIELHRLTKLSFWDALIVHAARSAGVSVLYSEDFQDGAVLGGVRVVNPFVTTNR
ncbi:MAG: twitching motility protein PilT [Acidobacteria bacterium]|nr:MAG: twitching motility protein PilT [Acidobacteriota bacterium]